MRPSPATTEGHLPVKTTLIALAALLLATQARADDADLSLDTKRMLAYGTLAVMTGACKTPLSSAQSTQMKSGLEKAATAQDQLSEADFTEAMKAVGAQVGGNKEQICSSLTPDFINTSLADAAAGR